jgi:hypothetical protein
VTVGSAARDAAAVEAALRESGFAVHEIRMIAPSMEDVFIDRLAGVG